MTAPLRAPVAEQRLGIDWFAKTLGEPAADLAPRIGSLLKESDFRYRELAPAERDAVILEVIEKIDSGKLTEVGAHRIGIWSDHWQEKLDQVAADARPESANPAFVGARRMVRLDGDYVEAASEKFELDYYALVRHWLFGKWFGGCKSAFEFGSGSAFNLVALARMYPEMEITGLDWAKAAVELADLLGTRHKLRLKGRHFDFFNPDAGFKLPAGAAAMTFCALEQVGTRFGPFLDYLLAQRPAICVHMEPIVDFYDPAKLVDALAIRYHTRRGYLAGFLPRLRELEGEGRVEILDARRLRFGSLFHEGFSVVVWRPRAS